MTSSQPAKALLIAAVVGIGLSGGLAAATFLPGGNAPTAVTRIWDDTVGRVLLNGPGSHGSFLSAAASYIGITEAELRTELGTDRSLADVALAHGKTRDGLIQALTAAQTQSIEQLVDRKGIGSHPGPGVGHLPGGTKATGDPIAAAATYLGLSRADLETKLHSGQSLAAIANSTSGKNSDDLVAYLVNDAKAKIAAAQAAGTLTSDQATQLTAELQDRMTSLVDSTHRLGRGGFRRGP
jgi:hypothetical protein